MDARKDTVLKVQNLKVAFHTELGTAEVLHGLDYQLEKGKVLAVVGESGCGKTVHALSLLKIKIFCLFRLKNCENCAGPKFL